MEHGPTSQNYCVSLRTTPVCQRPPNQFVMETRGGKKGKKT